MVEIGVVVSGRDKNGLDFVEYCRVLDKDDDDIVGSIGDDCPSDSTSNCAADAIDDIMAKLDGTDPSDEDC